MTSVRNQFAADLQPLLPEEWDLRRFETDIDAPSRPIVMLRYQGFEPVLNAASALRHELNLTLISSVVDNAERAEDELDEALADLMGALDQIPYVAVNRADKQVFSEQFPCFDLQLHLYIPITTS